MRYETAVVTGASRGLGLAVANALAERGLRVVAASRTPPPGGLDWVEADLSSPASIETLFAEARERLGPVDVLVSNAGIGYVQPFEQDDPDEIRRVVDLNLTGAILCARAVLPDMLERGRGLIVNVGSDLSRRYNTRMAVYTATKFGLLGFSGSLMREVKDRGVDVVCVMPGVIDTAFGGFAEEGSRGAAEGIPAADLAQVVTGLLDVPAHMLVHELTVHPRGQQGI